MKTLHSSKFIEVNVDEQGILYFVWKEASKDMTDEEYKTDISKYAEILYEIHPEKTFTDLRQMDFVIPPELQEWNKEIFHQGITPKKSAFLASEDFYAQLSAEQVMDEIDNQTGIIYKVVRYFDSEKEAFEWLTL